MTYNPWVGGSAGIAAALILGLGPTAAIAGAEPATDPHQYSDRTAEFVPMERPDAMAARDSGKHLVLSPHGTRHRIVCRGDGHTVPLYDCAQEDGLVGWAPLRLSETPAGEVWVYLP
ncbi:hypothetical protein [Nocardia sp. X0981]